MLRLFLFVSLNIYSVSSCSDPFVGGLGDKCYFFSNTSATWAHAQNSCIALGGSLTSVKDASENQYISYMMSKISNQDYWIDGYRDNKNTWTRADLHNFMYSNWDRGEPSGPDNNLDYIRVEASNGAKWKSEDGSILLNYVCESITTTTTSSTTTITTTYPCRVNVIFSLEASTYVKSEGESIVYDQINEVQNAFQSWTISPNSVRVALPKPIGCTQGGNWNLQNDTNSLNNVVSSVKRFLYTCFQQNSLSDYITSLNNQILQSQSVDPANYVFVIFTATTDTNDVQQAINLRTQFFDPQGYGLIVVKVEPQTAANLAQLATYGVYDLGDPNFTQDISSAVCNGKLTTEELSTTPYVPCIPYNEDFFLTFFFDDTRIGMNNMGSYENIVLSTVALPTSSYTERILNIYATSAPEFFGNTAYFNDSTAIQQLFDGVANSYGQTENLPTYNLTDSLLHYYDTLDTINYRSGAPAIVIFNNAHVKDVGSALEVVQDLHKHKPKVFVLLIGFDKEEMVNLKPLVDFSMYFESDVVEAANWTLNTLCKYNAPYNPPTTPEPTVLVPTTVEPTTEFQPLKV